MIALFRKSLLWKLVLPLPVVGVAALVLAWFWIPPMIMESARAQATDTALQIASQFKKIRAYYTSNIVAKVLAQSDIKASYNHAKEPRSIPLPATMIHDISKLLERENTTVSLYSPMPFPNRKDRKLDEFQTQAWDYLVANPDRIFTRDDTRDGKRIVRVALADRMAGEACVSCHNSHPDSPRTGWKLGDVRGVLEVGTVVEVQYAAATGLAKSIIWGIVICGGLLIALAAGTGRSVVTTIKQMAEAMRRLTNNELGTEVPCRARQDEIGGIAAAVQSFKDTALEKVRLEKDAAAHREQVEVERQRTETERKRISDEQALAVRVIGEGLGKLSHGDLTARVQVAVAPDYQKLMEDFNAAVGRLQQTMLSVVDNTQDITSGTQEIATASNDLSRRAEQQASSLEETAAALDQITATVRKAAEGATRAREVVSATKSDAEKGGEVVRKAVEAMGGIEKSSQQISQIIGVIDEIAFQTNLLALNAGVEAARAGDAGRGFAVVASEVRALAQRSAEAAKEIKGLISTSTTQVGQGVGLVAETGKSLERIMARVAEINAVVSEIANGAQEQATSLQEVNTAVNQMDQVTQQNAAMAEQSTAATHTLASQADELGRLVAQFQLGRPNAVAPAAPNKRVSKAA